MVKLHRKSQLEKKKLVNVRGNRVNNDPFIPEDVSLKTLNSAQHEVFFWTRKHEVFSSCYGEDDSNTELILLVHTHWQVLSCCENFSCASNGFYTSMVFPVDSIAQLLSSAPITWKCKFDIYAKFLKLTFPVMKFSVRVTLSMILI